MKMGSSCVHESRLSIDIKFKTVIYISKEKNLEVSTNF